MAVLWAILALIFGHPHAPTRGQMSLWSYNISHVRAFLVHPRPDFFVADATWLCWRLIRAFRPRDRRLAGSERCSEFSAAIWSTARGLSRRLARPPVSSPSARKCITTLLYGPFLIIALIVVSRSPSVRQLRPQHSRPSSTMGVGRAHRHRLRGGAAMVGRGHARRGAPPAQRNSSSAPEETERWRAGCRANWRCCCAGSRSCAKARSARSRSSPWCAPCCCRSAASAARRCCNT